MYEVIWIGGKRDGETVGTFTTIDEAVRFAEIYQQMHEEEFDLVCGGVAIFDPAGNVVGW